MSYNYFPQFYQPVQLPQASQNQSNGFVSVRSEQEARNYPVAYGNSVTFKDETSPYVYTKTMGFSQLDRPIFDKYKLVKEDTHDQIPEPKADLFGEIKAEIEKLWKEIHTLKKGDVEGV